MRVYIWVDDMRELCMGCQADVYVHAFNYWEAIHYIQYYANCGDHIIVDFDHDLGENKTGYDVAKYIVENNIQNLDFYIHSMNPVGRDNIVQLLTHYGHSYIH